MKKTAILLLMIYSSVCFGKSFSGGRSRYSSVYTNPAAIYVAASDASQAEKNASDYVCDGVADDVQIQAAIDAVAVLGGIVQLSAGNFTISSAINLKKGVSVYGSGVGSTGGGIGDRGTIITLAANSDCDMMTYDATVNGTDPTFIVLKEFVLEGNKGNQASGHGISVIPTTATDQAADMYFEHVWVHNVKQDGFHFERIWGLVMQGCLSESNGGIGVYITAASQIYIRGLFSAYNGVNQLKTDNSVAANISVLITNSHFYTKSGTGATGPLVYLDNFGYSIFSNNIVYNSDTAAIDGLYIYAGSYSQYVNNNLRDTGSGTVALNLAASSGRNLFNNNIALGWDIGIVVRSATGITSSDTLRGNNFRGNTKGFEGRNWSNVATNAFFMIGWLDNSWNPADRAATVLSADYTFTGENSGGIYSSDKGSAFTFTLPAATVGIELTFVVSEAQELRLDPAGTETIALAGTQQAAGSYITATATGETIRVKCLTAGQWETFDSVGTWTVQP